MWDDSGCRVIAMGSGLKAPNVLPSCVHALGSKAYGLMRVRLYVGRRAMRTAALRLKCRLS